MKEFKYGCTILALLYLSFAILPSNILAGLPSMAVRWAPEWLSRALAFADFLILGAISYGIQKRNLIFWNLIPILVYLFLLIFIVSTLFNLMELSLPWVPFVFVALFLLSSPVLFYSWWRNQRRYFS